MSIKVSFHGEPWIRSGKATIAAGVGVFEIGYHELAQKKVHADDDKYEIVFLPTAEEREEFLTQIIPTCIRLAEAVGVEYKTPKEAEKKVRATLEAKIKASLAEWEEGRFLLRMSQRCAFVRDDHEQPHAPLPVFGPDGAVVAKPYLGKGSKGMAQFIIRASKDGTSVKFPFDLVSVKLTEIKEMDKSDLPKKKAVDDFSDLESNY